jgi:cell shape-determining protein MreC
VGEVVEVQRDTKDPYRVTVIVRPLADLDNLRDVFILSPVRLLRAAP